MTTDNSYILWSQKHTAFFVGLLLILGVAIWFSACDKSSNLENSTNEITASELLGSAEYPAICYGGYRHSTRDKQPSVQEIKADLLLLSAIGIKFIRTYNVQFDHAKNVLIAIDSLQKEKDDFEMYVMLGAWIDCKNAWTDSIPDHSKESPENKKEISRAIALANTYPDIVKVIAVGNEAMVKWAADYYVEPKIILKWVNYLQERKKAGDLHPDIWITSSDNFASWGGGSSEYKTLELEKLIRSVDYISMHTYPMHDTHYNPEFWGVTSEEATLDTFDQTEAVMKRAVRYAQRQYEAVASYLDSLGIDKQIHIGETGWASHSSGLYGKNGSLACDELKQAFYYEYIREWTDAANISCFYFEAFDEPWKDSAHPGGSENHFGLFTVEGEAKYALWRTIDTMELKLSSRNGNSVEKTYNGEINKLMSSVYLPPKLEKQNSLEK